MDISKKLVDTTFQMQKTTVIDLPINIEQRIEMKVNRSPYTFKWCWGMHRTHPVSSEIKNFACAAKVRFSNWVFRSSSFSLFVLGLCHSSGSRFSSQSGLMFEWHRCKHMSDRQWRAPLSGALQVARTRMSTISSHQICVVIVPIWPRRWCGSSKTLGLLAIIWACFSSVANSNHCQY